MKENYIAQNKEILHKTAQIQRILHYNDEIGPRTKMEASLPFQKSSGLPALLWIGKLSVPLTPYGFP
ncbi:hypothetical protein T11_12286 [Trichinella zimbabwensis]|uniref:Uncharacterized protein n=1 Tax=Trichinella zimbabwensis TaxID=268475 RepID=A0A0V1GRI7_9BILA|nr:hypothetical protein T11_12286 [Trichinella zimbabwensis]